MQHLMRLPSPVHSVDETKQDCLTALKFALSIPMNSKTDSKRSSTFVMYYHAAITFPFVVTIASWFSLHPSNLALSPSLSSRSLQIFLVFNFSIINSVIALLEVTVLSDVPVKKVTALFLYLFD